MFRPEEERSEHVLTRDFIPIELSNETEYGNAERDFVAWIKGKAEEDQRFLSRLEQQPLYALKDRLFSILSPEKVIDLLGDQDDIEQVALIKKTLLENFIRRAEAKARKHEASIKLWALWELAGRGKVAAAVERIESFLEDEPGKLIVFAHHRFVQEGLRKAFPIIRPTFQ